jgi:transcriptional regulator with XRE-family HTH domain
MPTVNGRRLRELREALVLSQFDLAVKAHVSQSHLSQIELDNVVSVGTVVLTNLAMVLKTNVDYLVDASDDPRPAKQQAVGKLKPDEERLLKTYRLLQHDELKQQAHTQMRLLADLERKLEREQHQSLRQSQSGESVDREADRVVLVS